MAGSGARSPAGRPDRRCGADGGCRAARGNARGADASAVSFALDLSRLARAGGARVPARPRNDAGRHPRARRRAAPVTFWVSDWLRAFALTLLVEIPVAAPLLAGVEKKIARRIAVVVVANLAT